MVAERREESKFRDYKLLGREFECVPVALEVPTCRPGEAFGAHIKRLFTQRRARRRGKAAARRYLEAERRFKTVFFTQAPTAIAAMCNARLAAFASGSFASTGSGSS